MDSGIKEEWVAALRSGHYNQARGQLYDRLRDGHCCLGVLADKLNIQDFQNNVIINESLRDYICNVYGGDDYDINEYDDPVGDPTEFKQYILQWLGLPADVQADLINMNDERQCDFDEIADYIEEVL